MGDTTQNFSWIEDPKPGMMGLQVDDIPKTKENKNTSVIHISVKDRFVLLG